MSSISNPLSAAQAALGKAAEHVRVFHARARGAEYVSAAHSALARIDEAIGELYRARGILVDEIRRDQDERAVRVDRLVAESRAAREPAKVFPWDSASTAVLAAADALDPADDSLEARQLRETAESVRDHRAAQREQLEHGNSGPGGPLGGAR